MEGMIVARTLPRKRNTTRTTRTNASAIVRITSWIVSDTKVVEFVDDLVFQALGEAGRQLGQGLLDEARCLNGIGSGREINSDRHRGFAGEPAFIVHVLRAHLDAGDVADAHDRAVGVGAQDDIAELLWRRQAALRLQIDLKLLILSNWPGADAANRRLNVLRLDRSCDVRGRQVETDQPLHVEPDAHRIFEVAE